MLQEAAEQSQGPVSFSRKTAKDAKESLSLRTRESKRKPKFLAQSRRDAENPFSIRSSARRSQQ